MNRTIKFRGKRHDLNIWVYGDLLQYNEGSVAIGTHGRYTDDGYSFNDCWNETPYVDEETIGQFTGLLDKNGKEIYEGDMVRIRENIGLENVGVVEFIDGCFFVVVEKSETYTFRHALHIKKSVWKDMNANIPIEYEYEVLGNIVDNPELIKK